MNDVALVIVTVIICTTACQCVHCIMDFKDDADRRKYDGKDKNP